MTHMIEFDGKLWACSDAMPDDLWHDFELLILRPAQEGRPRLNRRKSKYATRLMEKILRAVVFEHEELIARVDGRPDLFLELWYQVMPPLLDHYQAERSS